MDDAGVSTDPAAEYRELVLGLVGEMPWGGVCRYGAIAEVARAMTGRGSARTVGRIMALDGGSVPWWRVLPTSGVVPQHLRRRAAAHLRAEGTPLRSTDPLRVDMARARWVPPL